MAPLSRRCLEPAFIPCLLVGRKEVGSLCSITDSWAHGHWCLPSSAVSSGPGWAGLGSTWACLLVAVTEERHRQRGLKPWGPLQWRLHAAGPTGQRAVPLGHPGKG